MGVDVNAPNLNIHYLRTDADLDYFCSYLKENDIPEIAFDVETDSTKEKTAKLYGFGFYYGTDDAFYVPVRSKTGEVLLSDDALKAFLTKLLDRKIIAHNGIYDLLVVENNYGLNFVDNLYHDTILSKHLIDEERPFGLKEISVKYLGPWADKAQQALHENIKQNGGKATKECMEMFKADTEVLAEYCCFDVYLTFQLFLKFDAEMTKQGLSKLYYEEEIMPLYREVTIEMKRKGFPVDVPYFQNLKNEIEQEIVSLEDTIMSDIKDQVLEFETQLVLDGIKITPRSELGKILLAKEESLEELSPNAMQMAVDFYKKKKDVKYIFNLNSTQHLSWLFFEKLGMEVKEKTEKGAPKLDADALEGMAGEHKFADKILEYKKLQKLLSTYIEGILDRQIDGVLYASFLQFGTTSGRYSCTNPNLQNIPRVKDEEAGLPPLVLKYVNAIKAGLVAGKGKKIVNADFSQLEPCCFAAASEDHLLQKVFVDKHDLYSAIAIQVEGLQGEYSADKKASNYLKNHKPELRQKFKAIALGIVYGAEEYRVASLLNCDVKEARSIISNYLDAYPGLKNYMDSCDTSVLGRGEVTSRFGRKRHLPEAKEIFRRYGNKLMDRGWSAKNGLKETRWKLKNMLNLAKNHPIQALASHIVNRAMIKIARDFKANNINGYIAATVHDEICCIVDEHQAAQASAIVKNAMENTVKIEVPLVAEPLIADNWADAK